MDRKGIVKTEFNLKGEEATQLANTKDEYISANILDQIANTVYFKEESTENVRTRVVRDSINKLGNIRPTDELERMLAAQMIATHNAAMECFSRARLYNESSRAREANLRHATKLMSIYVRQMDALNKHRGKGGQKVTVEYVNVESGGRAVVGNVEAGALSQPAESEIEAQGAEPADGAGRRVRRSSSLRGRARRRPATPRS